MDEWSRAFGGIPIYLHSDDSGRRGAGTRSASSRLVSSTTRITAWPLVGAGLLVLAFHPEVGEPGKANGSGLMVKRAQGQAVEVRGLCSRRRRESCDFETFSRR
jgi:hypothetical protein